MSFVADNSVFLSWFMPDEQPPHAMQLLRTAQAEPMLVPAIWPYEFSNSIARAQRTGRLSSDDVRDVLLAVDALDIAVQPGWTKSAIPSALLAIAQHKLTAYDASYLALALDLSLPLATLDNELRADANAAGVVCLL